ncbi:MAG: GNAT family acetyltransferase [Lachnospiraceae bacterium]|jgi:hypothetical protein|nr:GNAT family acetyltransferase [Lachnospiraceae bacterium]
MIDLHGQAGLPYINRGVYTGSYQGMRYRMCKKTEEGEEAYLEAVIYPEPYCFEATPEEKKQFHKFPFTEDGFTEAIHWLNEEYERQREYWEKNERI